MRNAARLAWLIALAALALRLGALVALGDPTGIETATRAARGATWDWGYEQGAIAQALGEGRGFSDPFGRGLPWNADGAAGAPEGTGPTGWATPLYPLLVAGVLRATGGVDATAAWTLAVLQILAAAGVCLALFRLGRALAPDGAGDRVGLVAAALWALHPLAIYLPGKLVWDSTFVALGVTWALARLAEAGTPSAQRAGVSYAGPAGRGRATAGRLARDGGCLGLVVLVNPAPLALAPALGLFAWRRHGFPAAAAYLAAAALVAAPWAARNLAVLGSPNLRTNLGVELFVGNNDEARGTFVGRLHPAYHAEEFERYVELGEVDYAADCRRRAFDWIEADPMRFTALSAERAQRFWVGPNPFEPERLGSGAERQRDWQGWIEWLTHAAVGALGLLGALLWRGAPGSAILVRGALLLFPLVYYVTHVFERYRFPLEPLVVLAAAGLVSRIAGRRSS